MDKIAILWTTDNKETIDNMLMMYTLNSKAQGWWDEVVLIIWGASAELVKNDIDLQKSIIEMIDIGIKVEACKVCADNLSATNELEKIGVNVRYMGVPLTTYLKSDYKVLSI